MRVTLKNERLSVEFSTKGAELQRLVRLSDGLNYMWSGDGNFWGKFSPVLFPIVGALKNDTYIYDSIAYTLPRHGFARDLAFEYLSVNASEAAFKLQQTEETLKVYPFKFELTIRYRLEGNCLICTYEVRNADEKTMLFSLGGHPAFATPIATQGDYSDYYLSFEADDELNYHHIEHGLISKETSTLKLRNKELPLTHDLFYNDALVFKSLQSSKISLRNTKNDNGVDFHFEGFPYFGIWAAKDANFVCLEPWCGIADNLAHDQMLITKEGLEHLEPGEKWLRSWSIDTR